MLKNIIKTAFRIFLRRKIYSFINIAGLALGMSLCVLIILYIRTELSYDRFHENADRIYRVAEESERSGRTVSHANIFPVMAPILADSFPEISHAVRFEKEPRALVEADDNQFIEDRFFYADNAVFDVFSFPLVQGNPETALKEPYSLVITEETAKKYFGESRVLERILHAGRNRSFKITGVLKNIPQNSHMQFDLLASLSTLEAENSRYGKIWGGMSAYTYILLKPGTSPKKIEEKIPQFLREYYPDKAGLGNFFLQPLTRIHLHSHLGYEMEANSDIRYIYIFSAIAFFFIIIACINFMNLTTARSLQRAKEVGVRKVLGAARIQLARQFITESLIMTAAAVPAALILLELFAKGLESGFGKEFEISWSDPLLYLGFFVLILFVGLLSGIYPAFFLSSFRPASVLYGKTRTGLKGAAFRKVLVVFQFSVSVFLIAGTLIIHDQLDFIQNEKLGFNKDNVVVLPFQEADMKKNFGPFKTKLLQDPHVLQVSASTSLPSLAPGAGAYIPQGHTEKDAVIVRHILCDPDFIPVFGLEITQGRNFRKDAPADKKSLIINQTAASLLGEWGSVGKILFNRLGNYEIIGVVKDFHFKSKHQKIEPLVLSLIPGNRYIYFASVKISGKNVSQPLNSLKSAWESYSPDRPFEYFFLSDSFDSLYTSEITTSRLFGFFTLMIIFIACLGLFGLAAYTAEQREKEMGIRKVMGASFTNIFYLLSAEFTKWTVLSSLIAGPAAYYFMSRWLENFAYRIDLSVGTFILSALLAAGIALATVSFQAVKTARTNPADSLRFE